MQCALSLPYGGHPRQRFDLFMPDGAEDRALLIAVHGGWWSGGRHEDLRLCCLALAEHGIPCATLGMRALGEGPRNGHELLDELRPAVATVLEEAALLGMDGRSAALLGSGSGSLIALMLAAQLSEDPRLRIRAALACGVTPGLDHADVAGAPARRAVDLFAGGQHQALSPLHQEPERFPPLLLIHGEADAEVPLATVQRFHARQVAAGEPSELVLLGGLGHQCLEQPYERVGQEALERMLPFLLGHLDNPLEPAAPPRTVPASGAADADADTEGDGERSAPSPPSAHAH